MSPRALTRPPDDARMWRRLISRTHPDAGGDHELFIWAASAREAVCGGELGIRLPSPEAEYHPSRRREASTSDVDRVPFDSFAVFEVLTDRAVTMAEAVAEPYALLLRSLSDCYPASDGLLDDQQRRGATYRQLAAIGHRVGMSKADRALWYDIARAVPLSQRHAGHVLGSLPRSAA